MKGAMADDPMLELMRSYLDMPGMLAAMLVSDQGLVINSAESDDVDIDTISALLVDMVAAAQRFGQETDVGRLDTMTIEFERVTLLLAPFEQDIMLALVARPGTFALK
jgi:predicted regulator of Ras-like GTPase activity (Roadblock/LC7/MglB family)